MMISQVLLEARKYEEVYEKQIREEERPAFHLSARVGWMNDPNGFSVYNGQYHLFYQYHPYESKWGPMHWGHAVSRDLLHWEYLPVVMAPNELYDMDGCFSGSALTLPDGKQLLMYTGVKKVHRPEGGFQEIQTQCLAVGNGMDYVKYEGNPVLDGKDLPEGASRTDFRDPKIYRRADGSYRCVAGNRPADGSGQLLLFESEDAFHWKFKKILAENRNRFGRMWECPDFFSLDGKQIILTSPQDMMPQGFEYHNGNGTLCLIGSFDEETETFTEEADQAIDYGIDFYAPQTILTEDGRRIMIGWLQNWDTLGYSGYKPKWFGQMSLPRELFLKNGRLYQLPIRELEALRKNEVRYEEVLVENEVRLEGVEGRMVDLEMEIEADDPQEMYEKFAVRFAQNDLYRTSISFKPREQILKVDRKFSGSRRAIIHQRRSKVNAPEGRLKMRLVLDRFSAELFINDGEQAMSITICTDAAADRISFYANGKVRIKLTKYDIVM